MLVYCMKLKNLEKIFTSKSVWTSPRLVKKEFTWPRSDKVYETLLYRKWDILSNFSC